NFVGIATGGMGDNVAWAATNAAIPDLRAAPRHLTVTLQSGLITVFLDGTQVLQTAVTYGPQVLVGFTAATGFVTDRHAISNLSVTGFSAHVNFQLAGATAFAPYLVDDGSVYGAHAVGLSYGWSGDSRAHARERGSAMSPDKRYDTLIHMQKPSLPDAF